MNLEELEKLRKKACSYYLYMALGAILIVASFLVSFFTDLTMLGIFGMLAGILLAIVFYVIQSNFKHKIKEKLVRNLMLEHCGGDVIYNMRGMIPEFKEILSLGLIQRPDRYYGEDYYSTEYNGVRFDCSDIRLQERHVTRDSKGRQQVSYVDYFNGRMLVFNLEDIKNTIFIKEKGSIIRTAANLKKIETEITLINERYTVLADDNVDIYKFLTPVVLQGLVSLEQMVRGILSYAFFNGKLYVFVERNPDALEIRLTKKLDEKEINFLVNALRLPLEIIDNLRLNSDYFKKR